MLFSLCFSPLCPSTLTKVAKVDEKKRCIHVHLFTDKNFHDPDRSLNRQMAQSELLKQQPDVFLTSHRFSMMVFHLLTLCPLANVYFFSSFSVVIHLNWISSFMTFSALPGFPHLLHPPRPPVLVTQPMAAQHQLMSQSSLTSGGLCRDPKAVEAVETPPPPPAARQKHHHPPHPLPSCRHH